MPESVLLTQTLCFGPTSKHHWMCRTPLQPDLSCRSGAVLSPFIMPGNCQRISVYQNTCIRTSCVVRTAYSTHPESGPAGFRYLMSRRTAYEKTTEMATNHVSVHETQCAFAHSTYSSDSERGNFCLSSIHMPCLQALFLRKYRCSPSESAFQLNFP